MTMPDGEQAASRRRASSGRPRRAVFSPAWATRIARRRSRGQWSLLTVVAGVAVLVATVACTLTLLVTTAEQQAARSGLARLDAEPLSVGLTQIHGTLAEARTRSADAVDHLLGVPQHTVFQAWSAFYDVPREGEPALVYAGELDETLSHAALTEGVWPPDEADPGTGGPVPVAVPTATAQTLGWTVGDVVELAGRGVEGFTIEVVGVFDAPDPSSDWWSADLLRGRGLARDFPVPWSFGFRTTDAVGPLIAPRGTMDARGLVVDNARVLVRPDVAGLGLPGMGGLLDRLAVGRESLGRELTRVAELYRTRAVARSDYDSALAARDRARGRRTRHAHASGGSALPGARRRRVRRRPAAARLRRHARCRHARTSGESGRRER